MVKNNLSIYNDYQFNMFDTIKKRRKSNKNYIQNMYY